MVSRNIYICEKKAKRKKGSQWAVVEDGSSWSQPDKLRETILFSVSLAKGAIYGKCPRAEEGRKRYILTEMHLSLYGKQRAIPSPLAVAINHLLCGAIKKSPKLR